MLSGSSVSSTKTDATSPLVCSSRIWSSWFLQSSVMLSRSSVASTKTDATSPLVCSSRICSSWFLQSSVMLSRSFTAWTKPNATSSLDSSSRFSSSSSHEGFSVTSVEMDSVLGSSSSSPCISSSLLFPLSDSRSLVLSSAGEKEILVLNAPL